MTTIEDVARLAGLSRTTVSRVINNHPYVSKGKKKQVLDAMDKLGYVPNSAARSLRNQRTGVIAVLIPRVMNPFFSQLIEILETAASEKDYQLIICQTQYSKKKELAYLNLLKTRQVDGVILTSMANEWKTIAPFLEYGPIILCNEYDEQASVPMVFIDQFEAGYSATKHLIEQGHERIAYCCGKYTSNVADAREEGFKKALAEANLPFLEEYAFRSAFQSADGKQVFYDIQEMIEKPTAIFTGSDELAAGIISEAKKKGWRIPEDLAVVGFDNQMITELMDPMITTIHQPLEEMGSKAIAVILEKIHTKNYSHKEIHQFYMNLIVRESTVARKLVSL
ncbi:LacI family transcriptional regulator [Metabacillus sp. GX 13764]|uniref:LacI family DNA-binding transcriptional regulator n=1 Tax=Metabacillus kandeliae TaxID=2900151 RepID=UPI001E2AF47A|nr:LacI family DNA-binding transcriptional regulator [Metabacillus kandeliae]MCD7034871.1 LacI family transcriptional regulator [Metabacillus kandeliae]